MPIPLQRILFLSIFAKRLLQKSFRLRQQQLARFRLRFVFRTVGGMVHGCDPESFTILCTRFKNSFLSGAGPWPYSSYSSSPSSFGFHSLTSVFGTPFLVP